MSNDLNKYVELKPGEKYAGKNASSSYNLDDFQDAKYILNPYEIVVDIDKLGDKKEDIARWIYDNICQTKTIITDNGIHLYFKKTGSRLSNIAVLSNLGVGVEYKKKEVVVKRNGKERQVLFEVDDLPLLPDYFLKAMALTEDNNLLGLTDNSGRHNKLFKFIQNVKDELDIELIKDFINNYVFDEPKSKESLATIKKDNKHDSFSKSDEEIVNITTFLAQYKDKLHVFNGDLYVKDTQFWTKNPSQVNNFFFKEYLDGFALSRQVEELKKQILGRKKSTSIEDHTAISFKNGFIDKGKLYLNIEYKDFTPFYFNWEYKEDFDSAILDKFFDLITENNKELEEYLYSIVAISLITNSNIRKRYPLINLIVGNGGNGKGIFFELIKRIFPDENVSAVNPEDHSDMSKRHSVFTSIINLGDDIEDKPFTSAVLSDLKSISMREKVISRDLYKSAITITPMTNLIYTSNHIPSFFERGTQITRRFRFIEFNKDFTSLFDNNKINYSFFDELYSQKTLNIFFNRIMKKALEIYDTGQIVIPSIVEEYTKETFAESDYFSMYIEQLDIETTFGKDPEAKKIYDDFEGWCLTNHNCQNNISMIKFNKLLYNEIKSEYEKVRRKGGQVWKKRK